MQRITDVILHFHSNWWQVEWTKKTSELLYGSLIWHILGSISSWYHSGYRRFWLIRLDFYNDKNKNYYLSLEKHPHMFIGCHMILKREHQQREATKENNQQTEIIYERRSHKDFTKQYSYSFAFLKRYTNPIEAQ